MDEINEQDVLETMEARIDCEEALRARDTSHTLCIDGTSATCKTTILRQTRQPVSKIQQRVCLLNPNTYFPSMMGYVAHGRMTENCESAPRLNDRSFLNTLEWHVLWRILGDWYKRVGNLRPSDIESSAASPGAALARERLAYYRRMLERLRDAYFYRHFRDRINGIAIIDSASRECDQRRQSRAQGSDVQRSELEFYTELQNLMYATLYPRSHIDLAWFPNTPLDVVTGGIAAWLRSSLLPKLVRGGGGACRRIVPLVSFHLPLAAAVDTPLLANACTHVNRAVARARCGIYVASRLREQRRHARWERRYARRRRRRSFEEYQTMLPNDELSGAADSNSSSSSSSDDEDQVARIVAQNVPAWMRCDTEFLEISSFQQPILDPFSSSKNGPLNRLEEEEDEEEAPLSWSTAAINVIVTDDDESDGEALHQ